MAHERPAVGPGRTRGQPVTKAWPRSSSGCAGWPAKCWECGCRRPPPLGRVDGVGRRPIPDRHDPVGGRRRDDDPLEGGAGDRAHRASAPGRPPQRRQCALGVAGAALALGVAPEALAAGARQLLRRRPPARAKGEGRGVVVYDDYGHHPTAIRETLAAIRQLEPGRRVWAVYEPLTYHRTAAMLDEFAAGTGHGRCGRDRRHLGQPRSGHDHHVGRGAGGGDGPRKPGLTAVAPGSVEQTAAWLAREVRPGDAVLVMGGGKSYRIAELLVEALGGLRSSRAKRYIRCCGAPVRHNLAPVPAQSPLRCRRVNGRRVLIRCRQ
jgi:hypothetical protein